MLATSCKAELPGEYYEPNGHDSSYELILPSVLCAAHLVSGGTESNVNGQVIYVMRCSLCERWELVTELGVLPVHGVWSMLPTLWAGGCFCPGVCAYGYNYFTQLAWWNFTDVCALCLSHGKRTGGAADRGRLCKHRHYQCDNYDYRVRYATTSKNQLMVRMCKGGALFIATTQAMREMCGYAYQSSVGVGNI